jgi:hypothetical protein
MADGAPNDRLDFLSRRRPTAVDVAHHLGIAIERDERGDVARCQRPEAQAVGLEAVDHGDESDDRRTTIRPISRRSAV